MSQSLNMSQEQATQYTIKLASSDGDEPSAELENVGSRTAR